MSTAQEQVKTTTIAALKPHDVSDVQKMPAVRVGFDSLQSFELMQRGAKLLAASSLVPTEFRGNLPNCVIALNMAARIGADPLLVMQNLYIVHGRPAWSAKFLIACFNQCGRFTSIRYIWSGTRGKDDWGCQAWAIEKATGEKIFGPVITLQLAKDEGWYGRKDSKWKTIPEKMFMYRAAAWMIDTHAPELSMGIRTDDEIHDTYDAMKGPDGAYSVTVESLRAAEPTASHAEQSAPAASATNEVKTTEIPQGSDLGGYIPQFDEASALAEIRKATSEAALEDAANRVFADFEKSGRPLPPSLEPAVKDRLAAIRVKQQEKEQQKG